MPCVRPSSSVLGGLVVLTASLLTAQGSPGASSRRQAAPSTRATAEVSLTLVDTAAQRAAGKPALIRIDYGQPHLRGRVLHTNGLVPFDTVWRLGANAATLFTTDVDLSVGGVRVPKGRYVAQVLPTRTQWTLILQAETSGAASVNVTRYDPAKDAARIPLELTPLGTPMESLSIWLVPSSAPGAPSGVLTIAWGTVQLRAPWRVIEGNDRPPFDGLLLVDGVRMAPSRLDTMDPATIASVDVLKGEAAVQAYGADGAKGVIRITTKH